MEITTEQLQFIFEHIEIINGELGDLEVSVAILKTQMASMIWWFKTIVGGFALMVIGQIWQIKILKKNNRNNK